ncbi:Beta-1,3-glucanase [Polaromonas sp. YR568]|uniref:beta-1,3-glucanase family protein n=1 Tax=Polaromonas sp. YR568 TaxID=1855301 RepID=UPI0008E03252|nr:beta-1,3-glucanase family protein [Polaromonas sp. YR568]SFU88397.1 Beta-1,3-glucanase [Polaromonas sp. YR568]
MTSYVTLNIVNNSQKNSAASGLADDAIYLFLTQEKINLAWSIDPGTGIATPMSAPGTLAPSFTLADLKAAGGAIQLDASVQVDSARLYLSSSPNAVSLSGAGNVSGPTAATAGFFYDFVELALACTTPGATSASAPNILNVDTTQVDQLGIPLTLQVTPQDPSFSAGSGIVLTLDRQTLVSKFKAMAVGPLAPFADCVFPQGSDASTPYRLLNPSDVIGGQLQASSLQGTLAVSGTPGAWQATFTITGPGSPAPTNGSLTVGMPVSGPFMPAGATVGSVPGAPAGNTVVISSTSSAAANPFTASTSPVELFFITSPTTALATYFDTAIDSFFAWCKKNPGVLQVEQNNNGVNYVYSGSVMQLGGIVDINGNSNTYTVLQFTASGDKESYNLYYPFFSTNSAAGKTTPFGADVPPPPAWWTPSKGLMYYAPPSLMVFGASGVFADNTQQPIPAASGTVLGAIENVIVTALARGYATTWKFLQGSITPGNPATKATVNLNAGVTTAGLSGSLDMASFQIAKIPMTAAIPAAPANSFSVSSPLDILPTTADLLTFSQFYPAGGTWSAFAQFLHKPAVTIDGRAYALPFDDQGGFSSDLNAATSVTSPAGMTVTMGPWTPGSIKPNVVPVPAGGNSIPLSWQACDDYRFDFVLVYDANGEYVTMDISIISAVSQFSGTGYTLPVALQTAPSAAQQETIDMTLKPAGDPYSGAVWCVINVPGFDFEGVAFEFSSQYSGAPPETVW